MTVALEQNAVSLEAPAAAFLASVSEPDAIRVLLIEEGPRGSLTDELSKQGFAVRTVISWRTAACDADVILLHCDRVNNSSIEQLGKLHRLGFNVPVVLLTGEAAPAHECLALDEGAIDVIFKSRGPDVLAKRLKGVVKTGRADRPQSGLMKCGKLLLRPDISRACWKDVDVDLTLGEYNIVHLLATNAGRYVPYRAIYDRLHYEGFIAGSGYDGYRCNVRAVIKRVRIKFGACDSAFDEIENYPGFGYCWKEPN